MKRLGEALGWSLCLSNTCQYDNRLFHFSSRRRRLLATEVLLGDRLEFESVQTGVPAPSPAWSATACCPLGRGILVVNGSAARRSAALVSVGAGRLGASALGARPLAVRGLDSWPGVPFLCQLSEGRALLCFDGHEGMWHCEVRGGALRLSGRGPPAPAGAGFATLPVRLPDGRLLVAGARLASRDIRLVTLQGGPAFEKAGECPGAALCGVSLVLAGERFVLGFGGNSPFDLDELWVFDLRTRQSSRVARRGEWHPPATWAFPAVLGGALWLLGGAAVRAVSSIPLPSLAGLILRGRVRRDFRAALGLPAAPAAGYGRERCLALAPPLL